MIELLLSLIIEGVPLLTLFFCAYFSKIQLKTPLAYSVQTWNGMMGVTRCDGRSRSRLPTA